MLTWLYVPGDRPDRFAKAVASGADTVILDLEDAVHPRNKATAREAVAEFCAVRHEVPVHVRINEFGTRDAVADLAAIAGAPGLTGLRLPKVNSAADVARTAAEVPRGVELYPLLESALGVQRAYDIATAHPAVAGLALGEADLRSDLGVSDDAGLAYARGRAILAARAAGLPAPAMSVYPDVRDLDGLAASCRTGRSLGFLGRTAIHPRQLPVIVDAFRPSSAQLARAEELLAALDAADASGSGTAVLPDGRFADRAMVEQARRVVALARRYPPAEDRA
ncbi:HpcH/HpaI aldolase/citrate lyase family protein [Rugosimonospora africana]|uniref:CoA ester lyase n=1 Tax=Rugosimonospora africana TaxID=556532 RepID=A0A8J3R2L3_9ACTN|nr:CoA ester lyase [Rugosimonospora africana]GIH20639.1 CoA ester lyase [Rugosimonospora africana]